MDEIGAMDPDTLPAGVRSRFVAGVNGLRVHVLEAGHESPGRPMLVLLHGFPEIAYSWRRLIPGLAAAGFHVVAPDARGYGRTTGGATGYDIDLSEYGALNLVRDVLGLVAALGRHHVAGVIGHDYGAGVAAACALVRPDVFRSMAIMSAPFGGPPALPFGTGEAAPDPADDMEAALGRLQPPRKHYHWYYATPPAAAELERCPQGLHDALRAYFHQKSADWPGNAPHQLAGWTASELAKLPGYYVMPRDSTMAETVAPFMPDAATVAACRWLTEAELRVYVGEYARTGFQGGLNWYRQRVSGRLARELSLFAGRTIDVPSCFYAGDKDWGTYQKPGDFEAMQRTVCTDMRDCHLIPGAGHWVQQEQPEALLARLLGFLASTAP